MDAATRRRRRVTPFGWRGKPATALATASSRPVGLETRVVEIINECRELLRGFAATECDTSRHTWRPVSNKTWDAASKLGDYDGVGAMLRAASIRIEADGSISDEEMRRFLAEGEAQMDAMQAQYSNFAVTFSIFLTLTVALLTLNVGTFLYATDPTAVDLDDLVFGFGDAEASLVFSDFATYAWPGDAASQASLRRGLSIAEATLLSVAFFAQSWGLNTAFSLQTAFGTALPTVTAKYTLILDRPRRLLDMYLLTGFSQMTVVLALPLLLARASALLALGAFGAAMLYMICFFHSNYFGVFAAIVKAQHREARMLVGRPTPTRPLDALAT